MSQYSKLLYLFIEAGFGKELFDTGCHLFKRQSQHLAGHDYYHYIPVRMQAGELETDDFVQAASDPVAADGTFVDFFTHHHGKARFFPALVRGIFDIKQAGMNGLAILIDIAQTVRSVKTMFV